MKKRAVSFIMILILAVSILPIYASASGSLTSFVKTKTYPAGLFSDVADEWFASEVQASYEYSLVEGTSPTTFSPIKNLTISEAIKLAACLNDIYNNGTPTLKKGDPVWYQPYVEYALSHDIIKAPFPDYTAFATRAIMADIFANALPDEALTPINTIIDNAIPDVSITHTDSASIYKLYRAGVLSGTDAAHTYKPENTISRAETASIVTRMAGIDRVSFTMSSVAPPPDKPHTTVFTISAAPSAVSVAKGEQATVVFTVNALDFSRIIPDIGDSSVASCTWGIPNGTALPLTIIGLSAGTTAISVKLLDAGGNILAEATVDVTVTGGSAAATGTYFPGYYPVPDYGVYVGTTPNIIMYDTLNGSTLYSYKISDLTVDMDYAIYGYMTVLEHHGFLSEPSFTGPEGNIIYVFRNATYHLRVLLTSTDMYNVPSIVVKASPF